MGRSLSSRMNWMVPFATGLPSRVTRPFPEAFSCWAQPTWARTRHTQRQAPAPWSNLRSPHRTLNAATGTSTKVVDRLAAFHRAQCPPCAQGDAVLHEADAAVPEEDVDAVGVQAPRRLVTRRAILARDHRGGDAAVRKVR